MGFGGKTRGWSICTTSHEGGSRKSSLGPRFDETLHQFFQITKKLRHENQEAVSDRNGSQSAGAHMSQVGFEARRC